MADQRDTISDNQRLRQGQGVALGDTGDGDTDVRTGEQGVSNRPGDRESDREDDAMESNDDELEANDDDPAGDELQDNDDEVNDPAAEPGKSI